LLLDCHFCESRLLRLNSKLSFATVFFETGEQLVRVVRRVVVDDIGGVVRVDLIDVFTEFASRLSLNLLDLLEAAGLHEGALGLEVLGKDLGELGAHVGEDVVGGELEEGFEGGNVRAHLDDVLEGFLGLVLEVLGGLLEHVHGEETGGNVSLGEVLGVLGRVTANLSEGPGSGGLQVVLGLVHEGVLEGGNSLGDDNGHGEGIVESGDVTEGHDTGESGVALGLADVVNSGSGATGVDDELGEFGGLLGDLTDAGGGVLADLDIDVLEAVENAGEDLSFNDYFGKVDGVLGDLGEALTDVTLELGVGVGDEGREVWDGTLVDDGLGELLGVLGDLGESGGGDAFEGELGLLDAEDEEADGTGIDDSLSKLVVVLGDARKGEGSRLLDRGVKLLEAVDEGVEGTGVDDGLGEVGGVLRDGAEDVGGGLLVESVLLGEGVDELGEDLVGDDGFGEFVRVVGEAAEGEGSGLLDRGNVIEEEGSEESHDTSGLECLDVLGALGQLGYGLDEGNTGLLVSFEGSQNCTRHFKLIRVRKGLKLIITLTFSKLKQF